MAKSKLTPKVKKKLIEALEKGNFIIVCCNYAGISESCFYNWLERAENELDRLADEIAINGNAKILKSERKFVEFLEAKHQAESRAEMDAVDVIRDGFKNDWRSAMAFLERRFRERWGRNAIGFNDDAGANDLVNAFASALQSAEDDDEELTNKPIH